MQAASDLRWLTEVCLRDKRTMTIRWIDKKNPVLQWKDDWYESSVVTKTKLQFLRPIVGSPGIKERVEINTTGIQNDVECFAMVEMCRNVDPFRYDFWTLIDFAVATEGRIDGELTKFWQEEDVKDVLKVFNY
jgi:hypothetical protein